MELIVIIVVSVSTIVIAGFLIIPILKANDKLEKENKENTKK